ncbi:heterokaryon incompatibility protein-domain-containing protein [Podospora didyma]|uniref:Heterokaryon incompatibility protein-domain-containing protein n=1 Tax=Podospora didyma TaxID=330526 RepID=A0AAE0N1S8_9PEZI|nr:heterokaryon incompatibility protein-domain-containing protein [Podospora didyma]
MGTDVTSNYFANESQQLKLKRPHPENPQQDMPEGEMARDRVRQARVKSLCFARRAQDGKPPFFQHEYYMLAERAAAKLEGQNVWQQDGISMDSLPQTFRDAVAATRSLGIDHLWIDCLCILQDSREDWASESSRMVDTYTNAVVTIAADQSTDCHGGMFAERAASEVEALPIKLTSSCDCSGCTVYARLHRNRSYPFVSHSSADHARLQRGGLHSRGWTLQERLLPRRVLHFTPSEMAWECSREVSCECRLHGTIPGQYLIFRRAFLNPIIPTTITTRGDHLLKEIHGPLFDEAGGDPTGIVQLHWNLIVFEFTARALTVPTDRLAALAGIASLLCRRTSQDYFFGLLSAHAVRGLLWRNRQKTKRRKPSARLLLGSTTGTGTAKGGFAPSWSFGSVTGRIGFVPNPERFTLLRLTAEVHGITRRLVDDANPYVSGMGTIEIEGLCKNPPHDYPPGVPWGYFQPDIDEYEQEVEATMILQAAGQCIEGWAFLLVAAGLPHVLGCVDVASFDILGLP